MPPVHHQRIKIALQHPVCDSPYIRGVWIGAYAQCFRIGSNSIAVAVRMKFCASDRVHVLQRGDRHEPRFDTRIGGFTNGLKQKRM